MAAVAVMAHHYFFKSFESYSDPFSFFINHGGLGVQLFFIISGFVIHFSVEKGFKNYFVNRFARIYPIFWIICSITFLLTIAAPPHSHQTMADYAKNMSIIFKDGNFNTFIDGSYWTLRYEIFFYILVGLQILFLKKKQLTKFYVALTVSSLLIILFNQQDEIIGKVLISKFALFFTFGGLLAHTITNSYKKIKSELFEFVFLIIIPLLYIIENYLMQKTNDVVALYKSDLYCALSFFVIVPSLAYFSLKIKNGKFINICKILGSMTYPLYLIHQKPGQIFIGMDVYGTLTPLSLLVASTMIVISYNIANKEVILRKKIISRLKIMLGLN